MDFQLIIFDCDGVLVDSEPLSNEIFHEMLTETGLNISLEESFKNFTGLSLQSCIDFVEKKYNKILPSDFAFQYETRILQEFAIKLKPVKGINLALDIIKAPICVASGSSHERINLSLKTTGLLSNFGTNIFSASDVSNGKPAPDLFLYAAKKMGYAPSHCLVIEDSIPGIKAAIAAGMTAFGYISSLAADALTEAGAHLVFEDMQALPDLLVPVKGKQ